ncbi:MAG: ChbG/HpnK family deacetylase [Traorella sp.]
MRKRLIYRCDDVGYTSIYDQGIFNVIDAGIGCSADIMLDAKDAITALEKLKDRPWVSIGWHRHLWERPLLDPNLVPSLVDEKGRFKWGHRKNELKKEATYEDAYREFEAEVQLCYNILGKYPDVACSAISRDIPLERAFADICEKYNIVTNFFQFSAYRDRKIGESEEDYQKMLLRTQRSVSPSWKDKNIISCPISVGGNYDLKNFENYKPIIPMTNLTWSEKEEIYFYGWHPGFLDDYIFLESTSSIHRVKEYVDAMSEDYQKWIIDNHVELINFRDALYGTNEMQKHLKDINSPLYIGNMK